MVLGVSELELWRAIWRMLYVGVALYAAVLAGCVVRDAASARLSGAAYRRRNKPGLLMRLLALRYRVADFYRTSRHFYAIAVVRFVLNVVICVVYVVGTYRRRVTGELRAINVTAGVILFVDLVARVSVSDSAVRYASTFNVFFNVVSFPSLIIADGPAGFLNFSFLRAYSAYRCFHAIDQRLASRIPVSTSFVLKLLGKSVTLTFLLAAGVQLLEVPGDILSDTFLAEWEALGEWHFMNAFYFVIVTLTTVGYGDFSPVTILGRVFVIGMIIVGIIVFTDSVTSIVEYARRSRGSGSLVKRESSRHVIVCGTPELSDLVRFTSEFYARSRVSNSRAKIVVLVSSPKWTPAEWNASLARSEFLRARVDYLVGDVRSAHDLGRAQIQRADAVFMLTMPSSGSDPSRIDTNTVMDILGIRNVRTDIPIYSTILLRRSLVQSRIAQTTSSGLNDWSLLFRGRMLAQAQYHGLRRDMLESELYAANDVVRNVALMLGPAAGTELNADRRVALNGVPHVVNPDGSLRCIASDDVAETYPAHSASVGQASTGGAVEDRSDAARAAPEDACELDVPDYGEKTVFGVASQEGEDDLARSASICLQDVSSAVLAAHVTANGLGTLITNMVLEIDPNSSPDDPPWLAEYHLGAACDLVHLVIPSQLHNVRIDDIAVLLYDHGLILVTTASDQDGRDRRLVLSPTRILHQGDIGMFLTYHRPQHASAALLLAAVKFEVDDMGVGEGRAMDQNDIEYQSGSSREQLSLQQLARQPAVADSASTTHSARADASAVRGESTVLDTFLAEAPNPVRDPGTPATGRLQSGASAFSDVFSPQILPRNDAVMAAGDGHDSDGDDSDGEASDELREITGAIAMETRGGSLPVTPAAPSLPPVIPGDGYIPDDLERHIIVCAEGARALDNLPLLVKYVWRYRGRGKRKQQRASVPIIVMCPQITSQFRSSFAKYDGKDMFFVEDTPAARTTWKRSKLATAKGVVMLADYGMSWQESDAQTIFYLMALDKFLKPDQDCFVVAELVDEKSLEYLREPQSARRVGVDHGDQSRSTMRRRGRADVGGGSRSPPEQKKLMLAGEARKRPGITADESKVTPRSDGADMRRKRTGALSPGARDPLASGEVSGRRLKHLGTGTGSDEPDTARGSTSDYSRAQRGVLLSRGRYASGDLLLPSAPLALLVREYLEPGFVQFYNDLLGAGSSIGDLKVRLVCVPQHLFDSGLSVSTIGDNRYVTYRELFVLMMQLGATPLGLYRSGAAPVRIPNKNRHRRGHRLEGELRQFVKNNACSMSPEVAQVNGAKESVLSRMRNTMNGFFSDVLNLGGVRPAENEWQRREGSGVVGPAGSMDPVQMEPPAPSVATTAPSTPGLKATSPEDTVFQADWQDSPRTASRAGASRASFLSRAVHAATPRRRRGSGPFAAPYAEENVAANPLPYVFTMPEPYTLVSERDGLYILCDGSFELPQAWAEEYAQGNVRPL